MKTKNLLFIAPITIVTGIILAYLFLFKDKIEEDSSGHYLPTYNTMEIVTTDDLDKKITGFIFPKTSVTVRLEVSGKIDADNRSLNMGTTFKKNEVLIKVDREEILLKILSHRSKLKEMVGKSLPQIEAKFSSKYTAWNRFYNGISRLSFLPEIPPIKDEKLESLLIEKGVISYYYTTKGLEREAERYIFLAPFNGKIIESKIQPGKIVHKGLPILTLAANDGNEIQANIPINELSPFKKSDAVYYINQQNTISKGQFLRSIPILSDSSTVRVIFSMDRFPSSYSSSTIQIAVAKPNKNQGIAIPKSAVKNDSIEILTENKVLKIAVKTGATKNDSVFVQGIPNHSYLILPHK
jgi:hypothetical protein